MNVLLTQYNYDFLSPLYDSYCCILLIFHFVTLVCTKLARSKFVVGKKSVSQQETYCVQKKICFREKGQR